MRDPNYRENVRPYSAALPAVVNALAEMVARFVAEYYARAIGAPVRMTIHMKVAEKSVLVVLEH